MMLEWFVVREASAEFDRNASGSSAGRVAVTVTRRSTHDSIQHVPFSFSFYTYLHQRFIATKPNLRILNLRT
jgi:aminoglycoside N3'-acetyltransferase